MKVLLCAVFALFRPAGCLEIFQSFVIIAFYKILDISTEGRRIAPTPSTPQSLKDHNSLFLTGLNNTVKLLYQIFIIHVAHSRPRKLHFFGEHQELRPLERSNTGSLWFTDFLSLCTCSELVWQISLSESMKRILCAGPKTWTQPEVVILGADQKAHGLWGQE